MRLTETQAQALQSRFAEPEFGVHARGSLKEPDMNKTEARYAALLDIRMKAGEVVWWRFEGVTLKLADDTRYTPDFVLMLRDGTIECHETKGFWRDDALVKIKVAAAGFPFRFRSFQYKAKQWVGRDF